MAAKRTKKEETPKGQVPPEKFKRKRKSVPASERAAGKKRQTTHHKFTPAVRKRYLEHLAEWGTKNRSAKAAGIDYRTVLNYLATHPEFQLEIDDALEKYRDMLLDEVKKRAVEGYAQNPIFNKDGEIVGEKIVKSDRLLEFAVKRIDPASREQIQKIEHKGSMVTAQVPFDVAKLKKLDKHGRECLRVVLKQIGDEPSEPGSDTSEP